MTTPSSTGPLRGVRILELAHIILGPMACQILADMGAEVIKVEAPTGDGLRTLGARTTNGNMASLFLACNRNKRSVVLDLKNKSARKLVLQLAEKADVVFHNNRPQVMTKLGLDYAAFKAVNPSIIYCGAYGYSTKGPYGERGAMDEALQAGTGISLLNKDTNGVARSVPTALADKTTALTAAYTVLGALYHRARTGQGQEIEVTMFETMVNYVMAEHQGGLAFDPTIGTPGYAPILDPRHKPFPTKDGWIAMSPFADQAWDVFCRHADPALRNRDPALAEHGCGHRRRGRHFGQTPDPGLAGGVRHHHPAHRAGEQPGRPDGRSAPQRGGFLENDPGD
jgi:crotonobetainyl-CoA:carnitine CoA-transferase CaiB-like acyl-CoA transferase